VKLVREVGGARVNELVSVCKMRLERCALLSLREQQEEEEVFIPDSRGEEGSREDGRSEDAETLKKLHEMKVNK